MNFLFAECLAAKRPEVYCHSIIASVRKLKKQQMVFPIVCSLYDFQAYRSISSRAFQVEKIGVFKGTVFPFRQIRLKVVICQMYKGVVKIRYMFKIDNKAAVRLKKTVFWQ